LQQALRNEQHSLNEELICRARDEVFAIARKTLCDLAATSLEQRMTEIFLDRIRELNNTQMVEVKTAFESSSDPLLIRTAFELPAQQRADIETVIGEVVGKDKQIKFDIVPELVSGIELSSNGRKIAWSIADYLTTLANSVDAVLQANTGAESADAVDMAASSMQDIETNGA
jgi:F-type H+-transporting ATPase subunit b